MHTNWRQAADYRQSLYGLCEKVDNYLRREEQSNQYLQSSSREVMLTIICIIMVASFLLKNKLWDTVPVSNIWNADCKNYSFVKGTENGWKENAETKITTLPFLLKIFKKNIKNNQATTTYMVSVAYFS